MDNSLDHRHLVLTITFVLALTCGVPGLAVAAPTANAASGLALEPHDETIKLPAPGEAPATQGRETDAANVLNLTAPSPRNFGLDPAPGAAPRMTVDVPLGHEIGNSIKETLRPLHDNLSQTGILNTVRNMESELGLGNNHELKERADGDRSSGDGHGNEPRATSWGNAGDAFNTAGRPRTEAEVRDDQIRASIMLQQLIDELTPWVAAAVAVYLLVYGIKLMRAYRRAKAARRRSRNSRRSRHKRRSSRQPAGEPQTPTLSSRAAEAGNNVTPADGSPP